MAQLWGPSETPTAEAADTINKLINWTHLSMEKKVHELVALGGGEVLDKQVLEGKKPSASIIALPDSVHERLAEKRVSILLNGEDLWYQDRLGKHATEAYAHLAPPELDGYVELLYFDSESPTSTFRLEYVQKVLEGFGFHVDFLKAGRGGSLSSPVRNSRGRFTSAR